MVRVGIIGIGFMGAAHFGIYRAGKKAKVVAICDANPAHLAGEWSDIGGNIGDGSGRVSLEGVATYEKPEDLIADPQVDLVDITLPTFLHSPYTVKALKAGKHVLCEKPMARNAAECERMVDAARKAKGLVMVAQCIRFWPEYMELKKLVDSKKYGRVISAHFTRISATPRWSWKGWLMNHKLSGGAAFDLHIHDTDFVQYLFGKPRAVTSSGAIGPTGGFDYILTAYDYGSRMHISAEGSWIYAPTVGFEMAFRVALEKATVVYSSNPSIGFSIHTADGKTLKPKMPGHNGWQGEIDYFLDCINAGKEPKECRPQSAALSVDITRAEITSARTRRTVKIK